jgi:hypothetical protein
MHCNDPTPHPHVSTLPINPVTKEKAISRAITIVSMSVAACAALLPVHAARGSCAQVIAATQKADAQSRLSQYIVSSPDETMTGVPMLVRVEGTIYTNIGPSWQSDPAGPNPVLGTIKAADSRGTGKCESAGASKVRGATVDQIRYTGPLIGKTSGMYTVWVDNASGLPLYHETSVMPIAGGIAWQYGSAVQPPANVKAGGVDVGAILKGLPKVLNSATGANR